MRYVTLRCGSCEPLAVNGVGCHEIGCPEGWRDLRTGEGAPVPCFECGGEFVPQDREEARNRHRLCLDCQEAYHA